VPASRRRARPAVQRGRRGAQLTSLEAAVGRYLDHLRVERGLAAHTLEAYRRDLLRYQAALAAVGRTAIGEVTTEDVAAFLAGLREGDEEHMPLAASSAGRAVVAVRGLHVFAAAEGLADTDPASQVRPPPSPRRLPRAIAVSDVERLIAATGSGHGEGDLRPLRDRALLELLYGTGARISEAVGLDVDDLGFVTAGQSTAGQSTAGQSTAGQSTGQAARPPATIRLSGKGGRQRIVPVGRYACEALDAYLVRARPTFASASRRVSASPAVFLNARGSRLTRQGAWAVLKAAGVKAGLPGVSPHTLRHSFATHLLDGGADVRVVQELLGHASVTTTQIYTLVTVDKLREVYSAAHPRALG
jgi:integrase/recombinase XerD